MHVGMPAETHHTAISNHIDFQLEKVLGHRELSTWEKYKRDDWVDFPYLLIWGVGSMLLH